MKIKFFPPWLSWNKFFSIILTLWVIGSWTINFYQLRFIFSPNENFGSPPKRAEKVVYITPSFDYETNKRRAYVFVETQDNEVYRCCSWPDTNDWVKVDGYLKKPSSDMFTCASYLEKQWNIFKNPSNTIHTLSLGWCSDSGLDLYSSYQINLDGTVSGKTVEEDFGIEILSVLNFFSRPVSAITLFVWFIYQTLSNRSKKSPKSIKSNDVITS